MCVGHIISKIYCYILINNENLFFSYALNLRLFSACRGHCSPCKLKTGITDLTSPYRAGLTYDALIPWPGSRFWQRLETSNCILTTHNRKCEAA